MPSASRTIYYLEKTEGFAEPISTGQVVSLDPTILIFKGAYLSQFEISSNGMEKGKLQLNQHPANTLLRPINSSDGPPNWSALVYNQAGSLTVKLRGEPTSARHYTFSLEPAVCYHADPPGSYAWESDISSGKAGYFLTGSSGPNALWRITRIQADALNRQVLTFAPVQLTPTLANPKFDSVESRLRAFLTQHFEGFQQAILRNAPFDAVDRANNLTEGVLAHCLTLAQITPERNLSKRLDQAGVLLKDPLKRKHFTLTYSAYHHAQIIRILHQRLHEDQSRSGARSIRPEVGLNLTVVVSELLVEVGLGAY